MATYAPSVIDLRAPLTFNERRLFELVLRGGDSSRAAISEAIGLTPTTISRLVTRLVDAGIFTETAERSGQLGQPRKHLAIKPGQAYSIGVNFMRGRFDLAVVDLSGEIVWMDTATIDRINAESIAALASERVDRALSTRRLSRRQVVGVGFSLPGGFAPDGEILVAHEHFPELDNKALAPVFEAAIGLPSSVDTDGACAVLGEYLYGSATQHSTFFLIHIGHGVGGGAVIGGKLFRGAHGNASKPGALFPYDKPRPSGQDLVEHLCAEGHTLTDIADLKAFDLADPPIAAWLDRAAAQLAEAGRMATAFLDPEVIFIGGRLPDRFNAALVERLAHHALPGPSRGLPNAPFRASNLGPKSGVLGAASLPIFKTFFPGAKDSPGNAYINGRRAQSA